jgi:hypothetical protein
MVVLFLMLGAVTAVGANGAPALARSPARAVSASTELAACSPEQYNADIGKRDCGASLSGPGSLALTTKCPKGWGAGSLCTPPFTLSLAIADGGQCGRSCMYPPKIQPFGVKSSTGAVLENAVLSPAWWCSQQAYYQCNAFDVSAPEIIVVPSISPDPNYPSNSAMTIYVSVGVSGGPFWEALITIDLARAPYAPTNVLQASIKLATSNGSPLAGKTVVVGMAVVATVELSVSASASGPVTGIRVTPPVALSPLGVLRVKSGPSPPIPPGGLTISPGGSSIYTFDLVVQSVGTVKLSVKATGTDPSGAAQSARGSVTARLGQPLSITVNWLKNGTPLVAAVNGKKLPDTLQLEDDDQGEIPDDVTAQVVVTNTSKSTQDNVAFNGIPPFSFATKAQAVRALPVSATPDPSPLAKIGTLAPGQVAKTTFDVHVTNNGSFIFSPQVLSSTSGSGATNVSEGQSTLTVLPTALLWLSLHKLESGVVTPGEPVLIGGTVANRSLTETLTLQPLVPSEIIGGGGGGELVDQADQPQPDGVELPFAGELSPGQTIDVIGEVGTSLVPGSHVSLTYEPVGTVTAPDGTERALSEDDIGKTNGSSPIEIGINQSVPPPPPSSLETIGNNFVDSTFFYTAKFSYEFFAGVGSMVEGLPGAVEAIPAVVVASGQTVAEVAELESSALLLATVGQALTPEQRQAFADQVVADFKASHLKVAADKAAAVYAAVNNAAFNAFLPFQNAIRTGDYNTLASLAGEGFGAGLTTAGDLLVSDVIFQKLLVGLGQVPSAIRAVPTVASNASGAVADAATAVRSAIKSQFADDITLAAALEDAKVAQSLGKGLPGIVAGQNLLAEGAAALTDIYGLTPSQIAALQNFCETNKLIIAVRSRSKKAAELIRDGLAVGKNEILKLKNVNEIDTEFLGYSNADLNTIIYAEPVPLAYVEAKLAQNTLLGQAKANALLRSVVMARYDLRVAEWTKAKFRDVIESAEQSKTIQWNFDGSGNGATTYIEQTRSFALKPQPSPVSAKQWPSMKGRQYDQVLVGNKPLVNGKAASGTRLVPVTQDVDAMAILTPSGEILDAAQRSKVYEYLSDLIGIEHGETPSWILDGEIIFQNKAKILADAIPGGEALAVFGPNGSVTAGFYSASLSTFNNVNKTGRIFFEGGYNSAFYYWQAQLKTALGNFAAAL